MLEQVQHLIQELYHFDSSFIIAVVSKKKSATVQRHMLRTPMYEMQEVELKRRFNESPHLKWGEAVSLAKKLNLKPSSISKWFSIQRLKSKNVTCGVNQGK